MKRNGDRCTVDIAHGVALVVEAQHGHAVSSSRTHRSGHRAVLPLVADDHALVVLVQVTGASADVVGRRCAGVVAVARVVAAASGAVVAVLGGAVVALGVAAVVAAVVHAVVVVVDHVIEAAVRLVLAVADVALRAGADALSQGRAGGVAKASDKDAGGGQEVGADHGIEAC